MSEWRGMETAPKDGTPIILLTLEGAGEARWTQGDQWQDGQARWDSPFPDLHADWDGWAQAWMPMPEKPPLKYPER